MKQELRQAQAEFDRLKGEIEQEDGACVRASVRGCRVCGWGVVGVISFSFSSLFVVVVDIIKHTNTTTHTKHRGAAARADRVQPAVPGLRDAAGQAAHGRGGGRQVFRGGRERDDYGGGVVGVYGWVL